MNKEALRLYKLDFTENDLMNCREGVLSLAMRKKIMQNSRLNLMILYGLLIMFSLILLYSYMEHSNIIKSINGGIYLVYLLIIGASCFVIWLLISIVKKHKLKSSINSETIEYIDAGFESIEYGLTGGRAYIPTIKANGIKFSPIQPLKSTHQVFDETSSYRFYYSSKSKTLLAVDEI